jgi:hypothetical protein
MLLAQSRHPARVCQVARVSAAVGPASPIGCHHLPVSATFRQKSPKWDTIALSRNDWLVVITRAPRMLCCTSAGFALSIRMLTRVFVGPARRAATLATGSASHGVPSTANSSCPRILVTQASTYADPQASKWGKGRRGGNVAEVDQPRR